MPNKLYLVRHAQSEWNRQNRFTGFYDVPLSEQGIKDANKLKAKFNSIPFFRCLSSTLKRAYHTAAIISNTNVQLHAGIRERDYGELTGMNKDEAIKIFGKDQIQYWRRHPEGRPPMGESLMDVVNNRAITILNGLIMPSLKFGNVAVISHGNFIRAFMVASQAISVEKVVDFEIAGCGTIVLECASLHGQAKLAMSDQQI